MRCLRLSRPPQDATLQDGAGHKPAYNLRTLCRALEYAATATPTYGLQRALWDGFAMSFLTQLDPASGGRLEKLMQAHLLGAGTSLKVLMRAPPAPPGPHHVLFDQFWVGTGGGPLPAPGQDGGGGAFVLTPTVQGHLRNLARAVLLRRYPILLQACAEGAGGCWCSWAAAQQASTAADSLRCLATHCLPCRAPCLQGPTSSGKTSLVSYLAAQTGHTFVRINNHEQTDLQVGGQGRRQGRGQGQERSGLPCPPAAVAALAACAVPLLAHTTLNPIPPLAPTHLMPPHHRIPAGVPGQLCER